MGAGMGNPIGIAHKLKTDARTCRVVVETPRGSRFKYDFNPKIGLFCVHSLLPAGLSFPLDFGFVPSTQAEDGDPLDAMLLADTPLPVGVVAKARLVGVLQAEETEKGQTYRNDRLLAVPTCSRMYADLEGPEDLANSLIEELAQFWTHKAGLEGKTFKLVGVGDGGAAVEMVRKTAAAAVKKAA